MELIKEIAQQYADGLWTAEEAMAKIIDSLVNDNGAPKPDTEQPTLINC